MFAAFEHCRMPAEWQAHEATWLAWPHNARDWPGKLEPVHWAYGEIVRKLAPGERIHLLVNDAKQEVKARGILGKIGVASERKK